MSVLQVKEKLSKAFRDVANGNLTKATVNTITAYAAVALLYGNGQRSGVVMNQLLRNSTFVKTAMMT